MPTYEYDVDQFFGDDAVRAPSVASKRGAAGWRLVSTAVSPTSQGSMLQLFWEFPSTP